jgi:hypothetical protein
LFGERQCQADEAWLPSQREVNTIILTTLIFRKADAINFDVVAGHDPDPVPFGSAASGDVRK